MIPPKKALAKGRQAGRGRMPVSNKVEYISNFEWSLTNRKLVVFMPNYKYHELTEFTISQIKTEIKNIKEKIHDLPCKTCLTSINNNRVAIASTETKIEKSKLWGIIASFSMVVSLSSIVSVIFMYVKTLK